MEAAVFTWSEHAIQRAKERFPDHDACALLLRSTPAGRMLRKKIAFNRKRNEKYANGQTGSRLRTYRVHRETGIIFVIQLPALVITVLPYPKTPT